MLTAVLVSGWLAVFCSREQSGEVQMAAAGAAASSWFPQGEVSRHCRSLHLQALTLLIWMQKKYLWLHNRCFG